MDAKEIWMQATGLRERWTQRTSVVEDNIALILSQDENSAAGIPSISSNDPATLFWLSVAILSGGEPDDRVDVGGQDEAALEQGGKAERLAKSFWVQRDREALADGNEAWLRAFAFWAALSGYYYISGYLDTTPDGEARPVSDVWSPLECYHEPGSEGLGPRKVCRQYRVTLAQAKDKAQMLGGTEPKGNDDRSLVTVVNYWWREGGHVYNAVVCESGGQHVFLKPQTLSQFKTIPVLCGPIAGAPEQFGIVPDSLALLTGNSLASGQTILDVNRPIYKAMNEVLSNYLEVAKDYASAPWLVKGLGLHIEPDELGKQGRQGDGSIQDNGDTDRSLRGRVYETPNVQASMGRVDPGRPPTELRDFIQILESMAQRGGLPYLLFAQAGGQLSGFAISQLITAAKHKLDPYMKKMSFVRGSVTESWLKAYRDGEYEAVLVSKSRSGRGAGLAEEIKPSDLPKRFLVTSVIKPDLPSDLVEKINLARTAVPAGPLMSTRTMQEELLPAVVPDPELDQRFQRNDRIASNPFVQMAETVVALRQKAAVEHKRENHEGARLLEQIADFVLSNLGSVIAGQNGSAPASRAMLPPGVMPPEAQGISPDQIRAAIGRAPNTPANLEGNRA